MRILFLVVMLQAISTALTQQCLDGNNTVHQCPAPCFCNATWSIDQIQDTDGIVYSEKYSLQLHLFQPPASDTRKMCPAVVMIHGGGFRSNNRNTGHFVEWCQLLVVRGYVCVSIDYRLDRADKPPKGLETANLDAMYDARAAVRWLRKNAAQYRIDSDRIAAMGGSAGAMTTAFMTTVDGEGDSGNEGFSSAITAGVSLSGALIADRLANVTKGQPPFIDFHGCEDHTVPYGPCESGDPKCWGSGVDTVTAMRKNGDVADLYSIRGAGHVPFSSLFASPALDSMLGFLAQNLNLGNDGSECPQK